MMGKGFNKYVNNISIYFIKQISPLYVCKSDKAAMLIRISIKYKYSILWKIL